MDGRDYLNASLLYLSITWGGRFALTIKKQSLDAEDFQEYFMNRLSSTPCYFFRQISMMKAIEGQVTV